MNGDGQGGLALAIMLAAICIALIPMILFGAAGWFIARKRKRSPWVFATVGVLLGASVGALAVGFTFFESTMERRGTLEIQAPELDGEWVVLLEDSSASTTLSWSGSWRERATLTVPSSGVLRVRSMTKVTDVTINGQPVTGAMSQPMPRGLTGEVLRAYSARDSSLPPSDEPLDLVSTERLVEWVREREARSR